MIDPQIAGISGDMILCSLIDLGVDKTEIINGIKKIEKFLPNSKVNKIDFQKIQKQGIESTELVLEIDENIFERKGIEIKNAIINSVNELQLSVKAKLFAESCINSLISSESKIHGMRKTKKSVRTLERPKRDENLGKGRKRVFPRTEHMFF